MKNKIVVTSLLTVLSIGLVGCSNSSSSKESSHSSTSSKSSSSHKSSSSSTSTTSTSSASTSSSSSNVSSSSSVTTAQFNQSQLATMIWMYNQQRSGAASDFLTNAKYYDNVGIHHYEGDTSVGAKHADIVTYKVASDSITVTGVGESNTNYTVSISELANKYYSSDTQKAFTDKIASTVHE